MRHSTTLPLSLSRLPVSCIFPECEELFYCVSLLLLFLLLVLRLCISIIPIRQAAPSWLARSAVGDPLLGGPTAQETSSLTPPRPSQRGTQRTTDMEIGRGIVNGAQSDREGGGEGTLVDASVVLSLLFKDSDGDGIGENKCLLQQKFGHALRAARLPFPSDPSTSPCRRCRVLLPRRNREEFGRRQRK